MQVERVLQLPRAGARHQVSGAYRCHSSALFLNNAAHRGVLAVRSRPMGSEKSAPAEERRTAIAFPSGREADRRVAGVAAAARIVHSLAESGTGAIWLTIG